MIALVRQKTTYFTISTILITVRSPEYTAKMFLVFQILITSPISPMDPAMVFEHLTFFVTIDRISNQTTGSHKSCRMESARFNSVQPKDKFSLSTYLKWILYKFWNFSHSQPDQQYVVPKLTYTKFFGTYLLKLL